MAFLNLPQHLREFKTGTEFKNYRLLEKIGSGGQGDVWSAVDRDHNRIVAIKFAESLADDKQEIDERIFIRQVAQLAALHHPYILPMLDYGMEGRMRYLTTPYIAGGSLAEIIRGTPLPFNEALTYAAKIASALEYLHKKGIVHRDLKPGNVLIDLRRNIYLADFGLARVIGNSTQVLHTGRGTPSYSPPEQHTLGDASYASDIFSFGILLYEIFTGTLPWHGEKSLGMQQLYSKEQLPDPRAIISDLPVGFIKILRQFTAANPDKRPKSLNEEMQKIFGLFNKPAIKLLKEEDWQSVSFENINAKELLSSNLIRYGSPDGTMTLTLTKFALVDAGQYSSDETQPIPPNSQRFMLQAALSYGYNDHIWWRRVIKPQERLKLAVELINVDSGSMSARIVQHLVADQGIAALEEPLTTDQIIPLLHAAVRLNDRVLRQELLALIRKLTPTQHNWQPLALDEQTDILLAQLAKDDSDAGVEAAYLIGHLRSEKALFEILKIKDEAQRLPIILNCMQTAGVLPKSISLNTRVQISGEWALRQLFANPIQILQAYLISSFGAFLAVSLHTYFHYRLPTFLDALRITTSIEHGLFAGLLLGLGLTFSMLATERLSRSAKTLRFLAGSILGGTFIAIALVLYDIVMLKRYEMLSFQAIPTGSVLMLGTFALAGGHSLAGFLKNKILKTSLAFLINYLSIYATWTAYTTLITAPYPIFFYDVTWPIHQTILSMLITSLGLSLPLAFTNLSD